MCHWGTEKKVWEVHWLFPIVEHNKEERTTTIEWRHFWGLRKYEAHKTGLFFIYEWCFGCGLFAIFKHQTKTSEELQKEYLAATAKEDTL